MSTLFQRPIGRRTILKQGVGLLAAPWVLPRIGLKAASERISVASIGVGIMGNGNLRRMVSNPDLQVVAVCDVDDWRLNDAKNTVETAYAAATKQWKLQGLRGLQGLPRDPGASGYRCRPDRHGRPMACGHLDDGRKGR